MTIYFSTIIVILSRSIWLSDIDNFPNCEQIEIDEAKIIHKKDEKKLEELKKNNSTKYNIQKEKFLNKYPEGKLRYW